MFLMVKMDSTPSKAYLVPKIWYILYTNGFGKPFNVETRAKSCHNPEKKISKNIVVAVFELCF